MAYSVLHPKDIFDELGDLPQPAALHERPMAQAVLLLGLAAHRFFGEAEQPEQASRAIQDATRWPPRRWEQKELMQALRLSKIEAHLARRSSADRYTARSAILFIDADSRLQLLPEERE